MFSFLYHAVLYDPLYNALVFLTNILPGHDVGIAIIVLTILVRVLILPLSQKAIVAQRKMKELEGEISKIKEKYKGEKEQQARATLELYRRNKVNPFSSILSMLIQILLIIPLYKIFFTVNGQGFDQSILYSFVTAPETVKLMFLGLVDMTSKSYLLAVLAGLSQFAQAKLMIPPAPPVAHGTQLSFKDQLARSMSVQTKYFFPILIIFIGLGVPSAVVLYWVANNIFMIAHELVLGQRRKATSDA